MLIHSIELKSVDSTNDFAKREYKGFDKTALTLIVAEKQTAGRGQYHKKWLSPPGQLLVTFVFFAQSLDQSLLVQLLAGVVKEVLSQEGLDVTIRWPNDLLIKGKKIAGILTEKTDDCYILGLGLNLSLTAAHTAQIDQPATSLLQETGKTFERNPLLHKIALLLSHKIIELRRHNDLL